MSKIALITDSSNDLPPELLARHNISVVPLIIHFGGDELPDIWENREIFWERLARGEVPRSAAPAVGDFHAVMAAALEEADEALVLTVTGKHSSTYNSALLAAQEFDGRVQVFDSWSLSLGLGLLVLHAASLIAQDASMSEILAELTDARRRLRLVLYLDSLDSIQRSGRIALAMGTIKRMSAMLSIKIVLRVDEGELKFVGAVRSARKGMRRIIDAIAGNRAQAVAVSHTRAPKQAMQLADMAAVALEFPREDILINEAGPILGVHGGFGAFGVAFIAEDED